METSHVFSRARGDQTIIARAYELGEGIVNVDITTEPELDKATTF